MVCSCNLDLQLHNVRPASNQGAGMKGFTTTIAKDRGLYRAVLHRDGAPVHRGDWHPNKALAELDRRRFSGDPWAYAPAFLPAPGCRPQPVPRRRTVATSAQQLSLLIESRS